MKRSDVKEPRESKSLDFKGFIRPIWVRARRAWFAFLTVIPFSKRHDLIYVLGCGRSGTTIIGNSIGSDAEVLYLNEPYYIWENVSKKTDFSGLFAKTGESWLSDTDVNSKQRKKLRRILSALTVFSRKDYIVEKTPINTLRIEWLTALTEHARFVVVKRNWVDIVNSIVELASNDPYQVGFANYNTWWGRDNYKIESLLSRDPYNLIPPNFSDFVMERLREGDLVSVNLNMAVFEALASYVSVERSLKDSFEEGGKYLEIEYDRFVEEPKEEMHRVLEWIKNGKEPIFSANAFVNIGRRKKEQRLSKEEILEALHPEMREKVVHHFCGEESDRPCVT